MTDRKEIEQVPHTRVEPISKLNGGSYYIGYQEIPEDSTILVGLRSKETQAALGRTLSKYGHTIICVDDWESGAKLLIRSFNGEPTADKFNVLITSPHFMCGLGYDLGQELFIAVQKLPAADRLCIIGLSEIPLP